jgi:hypothetical protein
MTFDGTAFGKEIVGVVKDYLAGKIDPLVERITTLEKRFDDLPQPKDGTDADPEKIVSIVTVKLDADLSSIREDIEDLEKRLPTELKQLVDEAVAAIPAPQDGKSVTVEDVAPLIASEVEKRVSELPVAKDGRDGIDGKDGVGLAGALIDRDGELVVTLTNGETKNLGPVVGNDGEPGKPGADAVGFDDLDVAYDGEKTVTLKFTRGDVVKEFPIVMPVVIDRGVYREGSEYKAGDAVTWGGSLWIAQKDTGAKPDSSDEWRLSVKRGRDGKDGAVKEAKAQQPVRVGVPAKGA